jgi:hypothetical protein
LRRADGTVLQRLDPDDVSDGSFVFGPWFMPWSGMFVRVYMPGLQGGFMDTPVGDVTEPGDTVVEVTLPPSIVARLSGRVTGEGPRYERIEGGRIIVLTTDPTHAIIAETSTDRDGLFAVDVALPASGDPLTAPFLLRVDSPTGSGVAIELSAVATEQYQEITWLGDDELRLPISTVTGSVVFAEGGGPVPHPTVMALGEDGITRFATNSRSDGTFLFYELPAGGFRVTAQDPQTGLTASRVDPVFVDTPTSSVYDVDWELPSTETVVVRAFDEQMQRIATANLALTADSLSFERRVGPGEVIQPNAGGDYVFERVPIGGYTVQGRWTSCPGGSGCHERFASLSNELPHRVEPDFAQVEHLQFVSGGQVQVEVVFPTSDPILFVLDAIGSAGPLGFWSMAVENPGSQPTILFENVPAGPVHATIR